MIEVPPVRRDRREVVRGQELPVRTPTTLDRVAPLLFVLLWSSSFVGARTGLHHMSPLWFVASRMILATAIMVAVVIAMRRPWTLSRADWLHCAVAGVTTQAILLMTAHVAMTRTEAAPIALIQTLNPLLSAGLAWPVLGERLRPPQILGLLLGIAGVLLVLGLAALNSRAELPGFWPPPAACARCPAARCISAISAAGPPVARRDRAVPGERRRLHRDSRACWNRSGPTGIRARSWASRGTPSRSPSAAWRCIS